MLLNIVRRTVIAGVLVASLGIGAGSASAFVPNGDGVPEGLFFCIEGSPLQGHPGSVGLSNPTGENEGPRTRGRDFAAWNASTAAGGPLVVCAE